ncbi:putative calcium-binding protein CML16 [Hordeum vulgare]|nr:putative calcium-binding protein CML16 [Hordeum vulgare]
MKKVFSRFDTDGDGRISPSEPAAASRAIVPPATELAGGRKVASMMDELDTDRDGYVDLGEFAVFHGRGRGSASWTTSCAMPSTSTTSTAMAASPTPSSARHVVLLCAALQA